MTRRQMKKPLPVSRARTVMKRAAVADRAAVAPAATQADLERIFEDVFATVRKLLEAKGNEYVINEIDRLDNFRRNAAALGMTLEQCWAVYAGKHWDAIQTYIRDVSTGVVRQRSEPIDGRIIDLITYLVLLRLRVHETAPY